MIKHLNINVYGLVQGVFFRTTAKEEADKLGITGFAENILPSEDCPDGSRDKPDGSVYIEAEGDKGKLDKFIKWCNIGPAMARIDKVVITEDTLKNFSRFEVR